ncbi:MAG: HEAT repeat domain-containing protein [Planctomycetes bacterium]|nr:HEAT repeat domain-containing protein [Planctomycetota bacterium]
MKQSVGQLLDQMPEPQPHDNRPRCDISQRFASCLIASHADLGDACDALVRALQRGVCSTVDDAVCSAVIGLINAYCQRERISQGNHAAKPLGAAKPLDENSCRAIERLYRKLGSASQERHLLLSGLARQDSPESLDIFVELICSDPPSEAEHAALAMVPLFSRDRHVAALLFPRLFDALEHACMAPLVLDLANFLVREGGQNEHPAAGRSAALAMLLGELTQRLDGLNESPELVGASRRNKMAGQSIALVISLCDALAPIGDRSVVGKLFQTLELSHRRIRTEAAAALARLGEDEGLKVLSEMAEQPLVRNRALAYLEELGMAGPLVHSFSADLQDLSSADVYAAFAGWQAEHEDIYELPPEKLGPNEAAALQRVCDELQQQNFDDVEFVTIGHFFGQTVTVATATRAGHSGTVMYQRDLISWCPQGNPQRPIDPTLAYNIYKGRILLRTFNPE